MISLIILFIIKKNTEVIKKINNLRNILHFILDHFLKYKIL